MGILGKMLGSRDQVPRCSDCGSRLGGGESILGGGAMVFSSRSADEMRDDYKLYNGSICPACRKVMCLSCVGAQIERCPHCGGATKPAYQLYLRGL